MRQQFIKKIKLTRLIVTDSQIREARKLKQRAIRQFRETRLDEDKDKL